MIISNEKPTANAVGFWGTPGAIRTRDLPLRRTPRRTFSVPIKMSYIAIKHP